MLRVLLHLFCFAIVHLAHCAATDPGIELLVTSVTPSNRTCYDAPGLPAWLRGTYLVGGPAQFEIGKYEFNAIFDGFGLLNRFELLDRQVCYTSVWLDTNYRKDSEEKSCPVGLLFEASTPPQPMMCEVKDAFPIGGDNNWVNMVQVGDDILLLSDTSLMLRLDLTTLEQPGPKAWTNDKSGKPNWIKELHMGSSGSAHPLQRPGTSKWIAIQGEAGFLPFQESDIAFYTYDGDIASEQARTLLGRSGPLKKPPFMHSFGVTPNYVVMPMTLGLGPDPTCKGGGVFCGMHAEWQGIHIIDLDGKVSVFDSENSFAHVHIVNAYENATGVTLDVGAYDRNPFSRTGQMDIGMLKNKTARDSNKVKATTRRVHLHMSGPKAGQMTHVDFAKIPESHADFYRVSPKHLGLPYCFYYATQWFHDGRSFANMAIIKHNMCNDTTTYWSRPNFYVGEPYMIPGPSGEEDDGVVVFVAIDGKQGHSAFVTLDAKTMLEVDGTSIDLAQHIPFTAHGEFFSSKTQVGPSAFV